MKNWKEKMEAILSAGQAPTYDDLEEALAGALIERAELVNTLICKSAELAARTVAMPEITQAEHESFSRFCDCCEDLDAGGHDVPKKMMVALVHIGLVRPIGFGRFQTTTFGDCVRDAAMAGG